MKRFLVFMYSEYYPAGGWNDFKGSFDSKEEILDNCKRVGTGYCAYVKFLNHSDEYLEIIDVETGELFEYTAGDFK